MVYENVERLCKERGVSIAKLERECGLGNATIRGWVKSSPTVNKVLAVANYFGVTAAELIGEGGENDAEREAGLPGADSAVEPDVPG